MKKRSVIGLLLACALLFIVAFVYIRGERKVPAISTDTVSVYQEANEALLKEVPDTNRVVFIGNSITQYWEKLDPTFFISNKYVNRGVSGQVMSHILERFQSDAINLDPSIIIIGGGINDIAENGGSYDENYTLNNIIEMVGLAQDNNIKVILTSVLPANKIDWNPKVDNVSNKVKSLNNRIKTYAKAKNILYVDYYSHLVGENGGLNAKYAVDNVHLNKEGYLIMEPLIQQAIDSLRNK